MWQYVSKRMSRNLNSCIGNYTYKELLDIASKIGLTLKALLPPKAKCGILCKKEINSVISLLACWCADLIPVPMSAHYGDKHNQRIAEAMSIELIVPDNDLHNNQYKTVFNILSGNIYGSKFEFSPESVLEDVSVILSTSGTTGIPKEIMHTKESLQSNIEGISEYFQINNKDTVLIARPICHSAVFTGELLTALSNGSNIVFFSDKYNPIGILNKLIDGHTSVLGATPTMLFHMTCIKTDKAIPLKKLVISGEPTNNRVVQKIKAYFPKTKIYSVYGLTEAGPRVSYLEPEKFGQLDNAVGVPLKNVKIKIVDKDYKEISDGSKGLIMVKSPSIMKGYYKNNELTEKAIKKGWLDTGDIGYIDDSRCLHVCGRKDELIIKAGMNIYPKEIEDLIDSLSVVNKSFVYGFETDSGQDIAVDIVLERIYNNIRKKDVMMLISGVLAEYQMPARLNIVENFNSTLSGKVKPYEI
ncbi:MAG: acyl--CoA ligase [Ruminococcaceae bacterium]|nr:acyl--CoA ligase [Oscillospiraceae bacterium]